jgi:hypothetical protein
MSWDVKCARTSDPDTHTHASMLANTIKLAVANLSQTCYESRYD